MRRVQRLYMSLLVENILLWLPVSIFPSSIFVWNYPYKMDNCKNFGGGGDSFTRWHHDFLEMKKCVGSKLSQKLGNLFRKSSHCLVLLFNWLFLVRKSYLPREWF